MNETQKNFIEFKTPYRIQIFGVNGGGNAVIAKQKLRVRREFHWAQRALVSIKRKKLPGGKMARWAPGCENFSRYFPQRNSSPEKVAKH